MVISCGPFLRDDEEGNSDTSSLRTPATPAFRADPGAQTMVRNRKNREASLIVD